MLQDKDELLPQKTLLTTKPALLRGKQSFVLFDTPAETQEKLLATAWPEGKTQSKTSLLPAKLQKVSMATRGNSLPVLIVFQVAAGCERGLQTLREIPWHDQSYFVSPLPISPQTHWVSKSCESSAFASLGSFLAVTLGDWAPLIALFASLAQGTRKEKQGETSGVMNVENREKFSEQEEGEGEEEMEGEEEDTEIGE